MNKTFIKFIVSVAVAAGAAAVTVTAEAKKKNKNTIAEAAGKKKTLGQLLKQVDRGAGVSIGERKAIAIPKAKQDTLKVTKSNVNLNSVKPPRTQSFFTEQDDDKVKLEKITDQQIQELYKLTQKFRESKQRGELWLRLAELYVEKAGLIDFRVQGEYDEKLQAFQEGKTKIKPVLNTKEAHEYNRKAIQLYEWFLRDFPRDEKSDQALFFLGYNYFELNQLEKGSQYYARLTKEFPSSSYVIEANFALGEYHFENERWKEAKQYYTQVLRNRNHRLHTFSKYKYAWTLFRTGDTKTALRTMEELVRAATSEDEGDGKKINRSKLGNEALRDVVLFYSEIGDPEKAPAYFESLAGQKGRDYVEKLAYFYGDKGNIEGSRALFRYMIQLDPNSPKSFDFKFQVVKLYSSAKKSRDFREELYTWVRTYNSAGPWGQANKANKELVDSSYKLRETTLRNFILEQHQTAQNSRAPFSQALAMEGYRVYVSEFNDSPTVADMHFYFGELLYDMKKYEDSAVQYKWVMDNGKNSKFFQKASENTLLSMEKTLPSEDDISKAVGTVTEPVGLDPKVITFIETAKSYIAAVPTSEKGPEIRFRIGRLYYLHNHFDDATPYFRELMQKYPKTKYAEYAANLLLDSFNIRKDYAGLEKAGNEILALPTLAGSKAGADVREVLEKASFKKGQDLEAAKDFAKAAVTFEAFAKQNPASSLAMTAIFNAAIDYEKSGNNQKATEMHQAVVGSKKPEAQQFKNNSARILAKLYQDSGQLDIAAKAFSDLAALNPKDPLTPNYIFNSAILYDALGNKQKAEQTYENYYQVAKGKDRQDTLYQICTLQRERGQLSKAIVSYERYLNQGGGTPQQNLDSTNYIYEMNLKLGRRTESEKWKGRLIGLQRKLSPGGKGMGAEYVAKFKLAEVTQKMNSMKAISIPLDPRKQQSAIKQKIDMINQLNNDLTAVIRFDSADEIVGALSVVGEANHHMYQAVMAVPLPKGLTADEQAQYKKGVEQIAEPFLNKAKESYRAALDKASQLDSYGDHYFQTRDKFMKLDPTAVYEGGESVVKSRSTQWIGI